MAGGIPGMDWTSLISFAVICPALFGLIGMIAPRYFITQRVWWSILAPLVSFLIFSACLLWRGVDAGPLGVGWMPSLQLSLTFQPDRLGLFFALLVSGIGALIMLYARAYFGPDQYALYRIYPSLLLFTTGMLGLVLADSFVLMVMFWELTSVSSFLLIGWERDDPAAVKNAMQAFFITSGGGVVLLGGLILLGLASGCWSFSALAQLQLSADWRLPVALGMIFVGVVAKSAQWPLHSWLPNAMAAPTPVSAYLHSATMVKAGVYLVARLATPLAILPMWPVLLITVGTITILLGAYVALRKTDLKLIFAYATVSQLGLLICMYGLEAYRGDSGSAVLWDITQILNHALYKAPLFILAGAIAHLYFTRDLRDLYGFFHQGKDERRLAILLLLAMYAMAAGPLTLGFTAKELFLTSVYDAYKLSGDWALLVVLAAVACQGVVNMVIFIRFALTLLGPESAGNAQPPHDLGAEEERIAYEDYHAIQTSFWASMLWIPAAILLALQYIGGLFPALLNPALQLLERHPGHYSSLPGLWHALTHPSIALGISVLIIVSSFALALLPVRMGYAPIWRNSIHDIHEKLFPAFYRLVTHGGGRLFSVVQTGNVRTYLGIICAALILLVGWALNRTGDSISLSEQFNDVVGGWRALPLYAFGTLAGLAALLMVLVQVRGGRVMVLSAIGYTVAVIFYLYSAPDLALTQVSIEIVALILFLLALGLLPRTSRFPREKGSKIPRLLLSIGVAAVMFWLTLSVSQKNRPPMPVLNAEGQPFTHLGQFFVRNAEKAVDVQGRHPGGGGKNVVNVILVDFRGLDTFGEITVLGIAALGVLLLLHRHRNQSVDATHRKFVLLNDMNPLSYASDDADRLSSPVSEPISASVADQQPVSNPENLSNRPPRWRHGLSLTSEPLRIATKLIVPLSLLFALFIFFKGHQLPGGGFVAGLMAAIALLAHRMAHGRESLRHMLSIPVRWLMAAGLSLTILAGLGPTLLGHPFLTSRFGHLTIPGSTVPFEWTTALVFDLGVMLIVLGVVLAMINALSEELEIR